MSGLTALWVERAARDRVLNGFFMAAFAGSACLFRYHRDKAEAFQIASGKGMNADAARISALGEAVERYCGGIWPDEVVRRDA